MHGAATHGEADSIERAEGERFSGCYSANRAVRQPMKPAPLAINLTVCEKVIIEEGTRNLSLIGTFRRRRVTAFPSPPQDFVVFAALIDGLGDATMRLEISDLETGEVVLEREQSVSFPNRLTEMQLLLRVSGICFSSSGIYQIVLFVDGDWIAHRHFLVLGPEVSP